LNTKDLVHGAIQAQNMTGGDLLSTLNTPMFNSLPLDKKVDFIHEYSTAGGPRPVESSKVDKIKHALTNAAYMGGVGMALGLASHMHKTGKGLGDFIHPGLLPTAGKAERELADQQFNELWSHAALPTQIGGIVGGVSGYRGESKRNDHVRALNAQLSDIQHGGSPVPLLFGAESMHSGRTGHFDQEGVTHHTNVLKANLFPFGAM